MKIKKRKTVKKTLRFYKLNFGIGPPYRIIVDGNFIQAALKEKVFLREQFAKLLSASVKLYVTTCITEELQAIGKDAGKGALLIARGYNHHKCGHHCFTLPNGHKQGSRLAQLHANKFSSGISEKCLRATTGSGNSNQFFVATQNLHLIRLLRKRHPGVPILRLENQAPILDTPTAASKSVSMEETVDRLKPQSWEERHLLTVAETAAQKRNLKEKRDRLKRKRPNPLSCMPKKKRRAVSSQSAAVEHHERASPIKEDRLTDSTGSTGRPRPAECIDFSSSSIPVCRRVRTKRRRQTTCCPETA